MSLSADQIAIIKATIPVLAEHGTTITKRFYTNLLRDHPALKEVFNLSHQRTEHQPKALAGSLYAYASHIDDLGKLTDLVNLIAHKHASLMIQEEHYGLVGTNLLIAMKEILGDAMTPEVHDAWAAAYWQLAHVMIGAEKALYEQAKGWTGWRDFKIARKEKESDEITSFYLEPVDGKPLPSFLPGQYISVKMNIPALSHSQSRQYSLSDRPRTDYYRISIKREDGLNMDDPKAPLNPGYVSNVLHLEKNAGDIISVSHPYGVFTLDPIADHKDGPVVLLSAGVGLTCLQSMLNELVHQGSTRPISFIHGARAHSSRAFRSHVNEIASAHSNVRAIYFTSKSEGDAQPNDMTGRVSLNKLDNEKDLFIGDKHAHYYICGPSIFMVEMQQGLRSLGVDQDRIHSELFGTGGVPQA